KQKDCSSSLTWRFRIFEDLLELILKKLYNSQIVSIFD
ncbi:unnamed protein product, partial [marine sediment metagenome]